MNYYLDNDQAAENFAINVKKFIIKTPFNRILLFMKLKNCYTQRSGPIN